MFPYCMSTQAGVSDSSALKSKFMGESTTGIKYLTAAKDNKMSTPETFKLVK